MGILDEKTAIITGSATGIGYTIAKRFHEEGAKVVTCDIKSDRLMEAAKQISQSGERICAIPGDVTNEEDIQRVLAGAVEKFGERRQP